MSSTTMRSLLQIRAMVRAIEASTLDFPIVVVRVSRVNQATRRSFSIAACASASVRCVLPVPDGPVSTRFSCRSTHSRVISAFWVASLIEESSGRQLENVLPLGSCAFFRRIRRVAALRPVTSASSRTRSTSAGSQRCARAVASTSGAVLRR